MCKLSSCTCFPRFFFFFADLDYVFLLWFDSALKLLTIFKMEDIGPFRKDLETRVGFCGFPGQRAKWRALNYIRCS